MAGVNIITSLFFFPLRIHRVSSKNAHDVFMRDLDIRSFTRQKNWVQTRGNNVTDRIILAIYTDNSLPRVGEKVGVLRTKLGRLRLH